jgi:hypothetical protein
MEGAEVDRFYPHAGAMRATAELTHTVMKVETHNHPTAIAPHPARLPAPAAKFAMKEPLAGALNRKRV